MSKLRDGLAWAWTGAAGAVWGLGLARVLALEVGLSLFLSGAGTGFLVLVVTGAVLALAWLLARRGDPLWTIALRLTPLFLPLVDLILESFQPWRGPVLLLGGLALALLFHLRRPFPAWAGFLMAFGIALALYLPDVAPWVGRADTFEFQVVAPRLGIAHPSGYPLYILVGKLFSLIPLGTVAWRVNLSSAVCAALAAGFLYLALRASKTAFEQAGEKQSLSGHEPGLVDPTDSGTASPLQNGLFSHLSFDHLSFLICSFLLASSPTLWSRAVEAEVYGLNALLVALALWLTVRWTDGAIDTRRALPLMGLLVGVGMASHLTLGALIFLLIPIALSARPRFSVRSFVLAVALFVAGLAIYLYIPLRWPAVNDGEAMSLNRFIAFVTNAESGGALHPLAFIQDPARWGVVFRLLRQQVGWAGLSLAALGLGTLFQRRWPLALGTVLAFGAWVWFNLGFYVADPDYSAFLIPAHVVLIFWLGVGLAWVLGFLHERAGVLVPVALVLAALLPLSRIWITGPALDAAQERADDTWGRYVLDLPLAPDAAILADSEKFPPLYFLQQVEGLRPDLDLVMRFDEAGYREELSTRLAAGQTVYLARYLPHLESFYLRSMGPLVEVGTEPMESVPFIRSIQACGGDAFSLSAFDVQPDPYGRPLHHLTLYWQVESPLSEDLIVRLRLADADGEPVWTSEGRRPVSGNYPTNAWVPETVVPDYHPISPPPWVPAGRYQLQVGLFPLFSEEGIVMTAGRGVWCPLSPVDVPAREGDPLPNRAAFDFDGVRVVGYDFPGAVVAGAPLDVELAWEGVVQGVSGSLAWVDQAGVVVEDTALEVAPGVVRSRHVLTAPQNAGTYHLRIAINDTAARCGWLSRSAPACDLGSVEVVPALEGLANFDGRILLTAAEVEAESLRPGDVLPVTLHWRALRLMEQDYTVTVQLVDPEGQVRGQVDSWPVQGTRPTSGWVPGDTFVDPYRVALAPGAPPGQYRVIVGWYLLGTMERLPVVDPMGNPVADHVLVTTVEVSD